MKKLYVLPFDHRGSFMKMINSSSPPSDEDVERAREYKKVIYDAFRKSVEDGVPKDSAGILVDEWLGKDVLEQAKSDGFIVANTFEKSGQDEFDFEREDWQQQLAEVKPDYVKVLVRYNPEGDQELNKRQLSKLAKLGDHLKDGPSGYLFELLVPATDGQMERAGNDKSRYEHEIRPDLTVKALKEIQEAGVDPDIWKLEGMDSDDAMKKVSDQVRQGNENAGIIILGRGESAEKAEQWLKTGAKSENAVGFAVGRTIFKDAVADYSSGKISRDDAVSKISRNYSFFVDVWRKAKSE